MYDRETFSLYSNLTGEPVVGTAAGNPAHLRILPMTLTTWEEWKNAHPKTWAIRLDRDAGAKWGFRYEPGAADRARKGVWFPVWKKNQDLDPKDEVYSLRIGDRPKAYSMESLERIRVLNDRVGEVNLVLIMQADSDSVRAYHRGDLTFREGESAMEVRDQYGNRWKLTEEGLNPVDASARPLERIPGHISLWFAWYGFYPQTELYK